MTARPSGAFCSPPSPSPSAIGTMPMIIASAVMQTGRKRVAPASIAARSASPFSASAILANETTRILFAVATPMHMMAPISAGTLSVVWVRKRNSTMPAKRRRQRGDDDEGIQPALEVDHNEQINQHDGEDQAAQQARYTSCASSPPGPAA